MDEWNPLLSLSTRSPEPRESATSLKVTGGIVALLAALGLIGWLLTRWV